MDNICSFCIDIILFYYLVPVHHRSIIRFSGFLRARCWEHSRYEAFILIDAFFFFFLHFSFCSLLVLCFTLALAVTSSALNGFFVLLCIWLVGWLGLLLCLFLSFHPSSFSLTFSIKILLYVAQFPYLPCVYVILVLWFCGSVVLLFCGSIVLWFCG